MTKIESRLDKHNQNDIKVKFERNEKVLKLKPTLGFNTMVSKSRITKGLACHSKEGDWEFITDVPAQVGGSETGPTPGMLGRAALGSCLAMGYMMWASKLEVLIDNIEIEIEVDADDGGMFATSNSPAGYTEIRYLVRVESDASESDIIKVLDMCGEHDAYLDNFSRAIPCIRSVEITVPEKSKS